MHEYWCGIILNISYVINVNERCVNMYCEWILLVFSIRQKLIRYNSSHMLILVIEMANISFLYKQLKISKDTRLGKTKILLFSGKGKGKVLSFY